MIVYPELHHVENCYRDKYTNMGYSGQAMLSVTNNRNLLGSRKTIWDDGVGLPTNNNKKKIKDNTPLSHLDFTSSYERTQIVKRRQLVLNKYRKQIYLKNILTLCLLIFVLATLTYIINTINILSWQLG